jgi:hypothetical protein
MRIDLMIGLWLMLAAVPPAGDVRADEQDPKPEVRNTRTQTKESPEHRASAPATNFTPTEKIKADSSVAFPADI